jgi:hypothetical protein
VDVVSVGEGRAHIRVHAASRQTFDIFTDPGMHTEHTDTQVEAQYVQSDSAVTGYDQQLASFNPLGSTCAEFTFDS